MNSVERIKYYAENLTSEAPALIEDTAPPSEWPSQGAITVKDLVMGYRDGSCALKSQNSSCRVPTLAYTLQIVHRS